MKSGTNVKKLVITALFIALSFVGANIKVFGTIAFDSLPGFLAALILGPAYGAAIGFLGHICTALTSGFPLSIPLHIVIALAMAVTMLGFGHTYKALQSRAPVAVQFVLAGAVGIALNGPFSLAASMAALSLMAGKEAAMGLLALFPALVLASGANTIIALILFKPLDAVWNKIK